MSEQAPEDTGRNQDGTFAKGVSGNPAGRPKGSRSKLAEDFFKALAADFAENGAESIVKMRDNDPGSYAKMIAGLMAKELDASVSTDLSPEMKKWLGRA